MNNSKWFRHLQRLSKAQLTETGYESYVEGRRAKETPRLRWLNGIKKAYSAILMELKNLK